MCSAEAQLLFHRRRREEQRRQAHGQQCEALEDDAGELSAESGGQPVQEQSLLKRIFIALAETEADKASQ